MSGVRLSPSVRRGLSVHPLLRQAAQTDADADESTTGAAKRRPLLRASKSPFAIKARVGLPCDNPIEAEGAKTCDDV